MSIPTPQQEPIYERIQAAAARNTLSHALLITGSGDRVSAARYAAAAMECAAEAGAGKPCGVCAACRKVQADIHPDVITVQDREHKFVSAEIMREMRADAYIQPNEGRRKVYLFPDCALLTVQDQNLLLKLVEEGPPYAAFIFCAENPAAVLQTLRSRCVELKLTQSAEGAERPPESVDLCRAIVRKRRSALAEFAIGLERKKTTRETVSAILEGTRELFAAALMLDYGRPPEDADREIAAFLRKSLTKRQIVRTIEMLHKYRRECVYNVGPNHVLGAAAAELEGILFD